VEQMRKFRYLGSLISEVDIAQKTFAAELRWWWKCLWNAEWQVNQQQGREEFECYTIWQMIIAMLRSNEHLRTEHGDTEKGRQKPAIQQKTTGW